MHSLWGLQLYPTQLACVSHIQDIPHTKPPPPTPSTPALCTPSHPIRESHSSHGPIMSSMDNHSLTDSLFHKPWNSHDGNYDTVYCTRPMIRYIGWTLVDCISVRLNQYWAPRVEVCFTPHWMSEPNFRPPKKALNSGLHLISPGDESIKHLSGVYDIYVFIPIRHLMAL